MRALFLAAALMFLAPGVATADVIFDPADADELAAMLAEATAEQAVCYGWTVQVDNVGLQEESTGSNEGAGVSVDPTCAKHVELHVYITYTSESSESEDSASYDVTSSHGGPTTEDMAALDLDWDSLTGENPDVVIAKAVTALPLLAADKGIAEPLAAAPETGAAPTDAQLTDDPGSDFWRGSGGAVLWGVGLMLAGGLFAWWVLRINRTRRRRGPEPMPAYVPDTVPPEFYQPPPTPDPGPETKPPATSPKPPPAKPTQSEAKPEPPAASPEPEAEQASASEPPATPSTGEAGAEEPTPQPPKPNLAAADEPAAAERAAAPPAAAAGTAEPRAAEHAATESEAAGPAAAAPTTEKPAATKPGTTPSETTESGAAGPAATESGTAGTSESRAAESASESGAARPAATEPAATESGAAENSAAVESAAEPTAESPSVAPSAKDTSAADEAAGPEHERPAPPDQNNKE